MIRLSQHPATGRKPCLPRYFHLLCHALPARTAT